MILQLLGAVSVVTATTAMGISFAAGEKYRLMELEQAERGILYMKNRISYLGMPLAELFEEVSFKIGGITGKAMEEIGRRMAKREGRTGEEIWREVWLENGKKSGLSSGDIEELIQFGKTLDFLEKEQREGSIDILLSYLREQQERIKKRLEKNGRLYCSIGVLSGLLLVVTLL